MHINTYKVTPTCAALAEILGADLISEDDLTPFNSEPIVNWGKFVTVFGSGQRILNVAAPTDKLEAFRIFEEEGISVPPIMPPPYLIRKNRHGGGRDIVAGKHRTFTVKVIDKETEYRVEVFNGKVYRGSIKYPPDNGAINWNRHNSVWRTFGVAYVRSRIGSDTIQLAKDAIAALGWDFGAVDIVKEKDTGTLYVLEANSAPQLSNVGRAKLASRISTYFNEN